MKIFCSLYQDNRIKGAYFEGHPEITVDMVEITKAQHEEILTLQGRAGVIDGNIVDLGDPLGEVDEVSKAAFEDVASDILLEQLKNITPNQAHSYVMNTDNDLRTIVAALAKYITWKHN